MTLGVSLLRFAEVLRQSRSLPDALPRQGSSSTHPCSIRDGAAVWANPFAPRIYRRTAESISLFGICESVEKSDAIVEIRHSMLSSPCQPLERRKRSQSLGTLIAQIV